MDFLKIGLIFQAQNQSEDLSWVPKNCQGIWLYQQSILQQQRGCKYVWESKIDLGLWFPGWVGEGLSTLPFTLTPHGSWQNVSTFTSSLLDLTMSHWKPRDLCLGCGLCAESEGQVALPGEICLWCCPPAPSLWGFSGPLTSQELTCLSPVINSTLLPRLTLKYPN